MRTRLFALLPLALALLLLLPAHLRAVDPTASETKTRETSETFPDGRVLHHADRYIDYTRAGKLVYRTVERTVTLTAKGESSTSVKGVLQHLIEFITDGKVFGLVGLDGANAQSWTMISPTGVHFSSGFASFAEKPARFLYVFVPESDYFEYLIVRDSDVIPQNESTVSYERSKQGFFEMVRRGSIYPAKP